MLVFHGFPCFQNVCSCFFTFFPSVFLELSLYKMENMGRTLRGSHYKMENMGRTLGGPSTKSQTWLKNGGARSLQTNPSLGFCRGAHFPFAHVFHFVVAAFGNQVEVGASRRPAVWNLVVARLCQAIQNTGSRPVRAHPKRDQFWIL